MNSNQNVNLSFKNKMLSNFVSEKILSIVPTLTHDQKYLACHLIGSVDWEKLDNNARREVGAIIFSMVKKATLPLSYAGKTSSNKHTYWLKK